MSVKEIKMLWLRQQRVRFTRGLAIPKQTLCFPRLDFVHSNGLVESFEDYFAQVGEWQRLALAQIPNHLRDKDLAWLRMGTKTSRQYNRSTKQVAMFLYGLSGAKAYP